MRGLGSRDSDGSSLSMELSLETEAVAISPSASVGFVLLRTQAGFGRGKNSDGFDRLSSSDFDDVLMLESVRPILESCDLGRGSGWAGLSTKL